MDWLNLNIATLDSAEFLCSEDVAQATWLRLLRYCIGQENGGVIVSAKNWPDRVWQHIVRVKRVVLMRPSRLWEWKGEDLHVWAYPVDKEREVTAKREGGKATAAKRWGTTVAQPVAELHGKLLAQPVAELMRKGKEGKGREGEGEATALIPSLQQAQEWFERSESGYSADQVRAAYESLQATRHPEGWWQFGKSMVTDWRMGLASRLERMFAEKNNAAPAAGRVEGGPPVARAGGVDWAGVRQ